MLSARTTAAATKKKKKKKKKSKPTRAKPQKRHLLDAIKAKSVDAIVDFYIAAVDATHLVDPANGDNPIHTAIRTANEPTLKAVLLLFGSEYLLSKKNKADETPLQLAKQFAPQIRADLKLYIRSYEGLDTSLDSESTTKRRQQANPNDGEESTKSSTIKGKQKVMLTLDGGGIRGLVSTRVLMIIERHLGKELWPLVGWCTGTSTGALLACALGTGKSLDQCQRLYFDMKNKVFRGRRPYSSKELEKILMESLTKKPLNSIVGPKLLITACRGDVAPPALVLFRNYQLPPGLSNWDKLDEMGHIRYPENTPIWYAARCSSAAPSYFPPCDGVFVDGGLMCNNPTIEALTEIVTLKTYEDQPLPSCVLSIGTGTAPTRNLALKGRAPLTCRLLRLLNRHAEFMRIMIQCLMKQISESNVRPVAQARAFCRALAIPFFRFSPTLTRDVRIDEVDNAVILEMLWDVELVMAKSTTKRHMRELICLLSQIA